MRVHGLVDVRNQLLEAGLDVLAECFISHLRTNLLAQHHQRVGLRLVGPGDTHHFDGLVRHQAVLDRCWGDVLTLAGLEDFLDAAGQLQASHLVDFAFVAGFQETVL